MAQYVTVWFMRVEWADNVRTHIVAALRNPERQVWLTGNVRIDGGDNAGDHIVRRQLGSSDLEELGSSRITMMLIPPFLERVDSEGAQGITVRFKVEISGGESVEQVGQTIAQPLPPPFHQPVTTTPAPARTGTGGASPYELRWDAHNELVVRRPRTTGPYPAARNLTTTARLPNAPNCWQYNPVHNNTLVVGKTEYRAPVLYEFFNWHGWDTAENNRGGGMFSSVFHQPKRHHGSTVCRNLSDIETIILHETGGGWNLDRPHRMIGRWCGNGIGAQFNVASDGKIIQYYDVVQRVGHLSTHRNNDGVGIEFSNKTWTNLTPGQQERPNRAASDRTPRRVIRAWDGMHNGFVVPPNAQLDALYELVRRLLEILPNVPSDFRALDAHGEPHQAGDTRKLFLMGRWENVYNVASLPGLYSHYNVYHHTDGSFQSLYLWLRMKANLSGYDGTHPSDKAYNAAIDLVSNHMVHHPCSAGGSRYFVDVTSVYRSGSP